VARQLRYAGSAAVCFDAPPLEHREAIQKLIDKRARGEDFTAGDINFLLDGLDTASSKLFNISTQTRATFDHGRVVPTRTDEAIIAEYCMKDLDNLAEDNGLCL
jgi:hypothetical protein